LVYLNSFNEWHEGHQFEPMKNDAALPEEQASRHYHNAADGGYRLKTLTSLLATVEGGRGDGTARADRVRMAALWQHSSWSRDGPPEKSPRGGGRRRRFRRLAGETIRLRRCRAGRRLACRGGQSASRGGSRRGVPRASQCWRPLRRRLRVRSARTHSRG